MCSCASKQVTYAQYTLLWDSYCLPTKCTKHHEAERNRALFHANSNSCCRLPRACSNLHQHQCWANGASLELTALCHTSGQKMILYVMRLARMHTCQKLQQVVCLQLCCVLSPVNLV